MILCKNGRTNTPRKTLLDDLREKYPNYHHDIGDTTPTICPCGLGYEELEEGIPCPANSCEECWNRPLDEVEK